MTFIVVAVPLELIRLICIQVESRRRSCLYCYNSNIKPATSFRLDLRLDTTMRNVVRYELTCWVDRTL